MQFELQLLGTNAAFPTLERFSTAQVLTVGNRSYMIDCGEGAIIRVQQFKVSMRKVSQIFISHLHGDHCFGLAGILSSLALGGRTAPMQIFSPPGLKEMITAQLNVIDAYEPFPMQFIVVDPTEHQLIFQDETVEVFTLPLVHRVPCTGYLFRERPRRLKMQKEKIQTYQLDLPQILAAKKGEDLLLPDGRLIPNKELTREQIPPRSYAFCSDTAFLPQLASWVQDVDLLYHESTFLNADAQKATDTGHSTAGQAATIAAAANAKKLVLGHFSARYPDLSVFLEEAKAVFPNTVLGEDGLKIEV